VHPVAAVGQTVLVDCGTTSLVGLKAQRIDPNTIDVVVVTHLHGDHFGGLPFLVLDGQFSRRSAPLVVAGPPGTGVRLAQAMEVLFPGSSRVKRRFPLEVVELARDGAPVDFGAATVRGWEVEHACGAPPLAVTVALGGSVFAYSGDTQWTPALIEASRGADLFAVEAYTYDRSIRYHLDYRTLRTHMHEITAAQTVLTHMSTSMLARLTATDLPAAYDGMTIDI
jgi:ribonuclease BN (tRNA processing enzyme)